MIYFEGTYATTFSRPDADATPRYDYNQVMYRLDLSDPRLALPQRGPRRGSGAARSRDRPAERGFCNSM